MSFEQNIPELESMLLDISKWFMNNNLKDNAEKFHLLHPIQGPNNNS